MQIVIDIPQKVYDEALSGDGTGAIWAGYVKNGIPLPEHHGRLKDIDKIISDGISKGFCDWYDEMKYAPTIIEAED